jgi:hypothetical protein
MLSLFCHFIFSRIAVEHYIDLTFVLDFKYITKEIIGFPIIDLERTWWRLFQKRVVHTKFDIYVFNTMWKQLIILNSVQEVHATFVLLDL